MLNMPQNIKKKKYFPLGMVTCFYQTVVSYKMCFKLSSSVLTIYLKRFCVKCLIVFLMMKPKVRHACLEMCLPLFFLQLVGGIVPIDLQFEFDLIVWVTQTVVAHCAPPPSFPTIRLSVHPSIRLSPYHRYHIYFMFLLCFT